MLLPHLTKLLSVLLLFVTVAAFPALPPSVNTVTAPQCQPGCQPMYARCLSNNPNVGFCREFVCDYYGDKCTSCQACDFYLASTNGAQTEFIPTGPSSLTAAAPSAISPTKRAANKPSPSNHCIVVCTHAHCDTMCANPRTSASSDDTSQITDTEDLLATTNSHPGELGIPLSPGADAVVLGQKEDDGQTKKCAWFCTANALSCTEKCWAANDVLDAAVMDGGYLAADEPADKGTECQGMDKDGVGRFIVCSSTMVDDGAVVAGDKDGMNGMRCTLFWKDAKPHLDCQKM